jgi:hypothetical protein
MDDETWYGSFWIKYLRKISFKLYDVEAKCRKDGKLQSAAFCVLFADDGAQRDSAPVKRCPRRVAAATTRPS